MLRVTFCLLILISFATQSQAEETQYRIGATIPLTGDFATYGQAIRTGLELAEKELKSSGYNIKFFYEDVNLPNKSAVTAVRKLVRQDKIDGLAGNFINPAMLIMSDEIKQKKIPSFQTAAMDDLLIEASDYIVSTNTAIKAEAKLIAKYAYNNLKARNASVGYIGTTFGENYAEHFKSKFKNLGGKILSFDLTSLDERDHRALLTKIRHKNPDLFFAGYFGTNMGAILKQSKNIGLKMPIMGVYETEDPSVIDVGKNAANGVLFFTPEPPENNPGRKKYMEKYSDIPYAKHILAVNAYDALHILVKSLSQCDKEPECTIKKIYETKDYDGASGKFSIQADGSAKKLFTLKTIKNKKFVPVDVQ